MSALVRVVAGVIALAGILAATDHAASNGALAVGASNPTKDGIAYGTAVGYSSIEKARSTALKNCETYKEAPKAAKSCRIIGTFADGCLAVAFDPKDDMPGVGSAVAPDWQTAERRALDACRASSPKSRRDACKLDILRCDHKDPDRDIAAYDRIATLFPNDVYPFKARGLAYQNKSDYARAVLNFEEVTRIQPREANAWNRLCWARALAGQLEQALKDCNESLRLAPNIADTLDSRGFAYLKLGQFDKAIADYDAALKVDPKLASSLHGRGIAKQKNGDNAGGEADMAAAKTMDAKIAERFAGYGVK